MTPPAFSWGSLDDVRVLNEAAVKVEQKFIVTTEDKVRLCLISHLEGVTRSRDWWTPASVLVAIILTCVTATFHQALWLDAATWRAIFVLTGFGVAAWLVMAVARTRRRPKIQDVIDKIWAGAEKVVWDGRVGKPRE